MFPATLAIMLRERSYMGEVAIKYTLRNYGYANDGGTPFDVFTTDGNYRAIPVPGGFHVRSVSLNPNRRGF